MPDCTSLKPGDKAMIVRNSHYGLIVERVTVEKIYKNGLIVIENSSTKYRQKTGDPAGESYSFSPFSLRPWDDDLWQEYQDEITYRRKALKLRRLGEALRRMGLGKDAAALWDSLPESVRNLIKTD